MRVPVMQEGQYLTSVLMPFYMLFIFFEKNYGKKNYGNVLVIL